MPARMLALVRFPCLVPTTTKVVFRTAILLEREGLYNTICRKTPSVLASRIAKELSYSGLVSPSWTPYSSRTPVTSFWSHIVGPRIVKTVFSSPIARTINRGSFDFVSCGGNKRQFLTNLNLIPSRLTSQSITLRSLTTTLRTCAYRL